MIHLEVLHCKVPDYIRDFALEKAKRAISSHCYGENPYQTTFLGTIGENIIDELQGIPMTALDFGTDILTETRNDLKTQAYKGTRPPADYWGLNYSARQADLLKDDEYIWYSLYNDETRWWSLLGQKKREDVIKKENFVGKGQPFPANPDWKATTDTYAITIADLEEFDNFTWLNPTEDILPYIGNKSLV